jgi:hypothetical protein
MIHYLWEHLVDEAVLVLDYDSSSRIRPLQCVFELRFLHSLLIIRRFKLCTTYLEHFCQRFEEDS